MQQDAITMQHDANPSARPEPPPDSSSYINLVGIRVPPFRPKKPAVWFAQLQGQFALSSIMQESTKFITSFLSCRTSTRRGWRMS